MRSLAALSLLALAASPACLLESEYDCRVDELCGISPEEAGAVCREALTMPSSSRQEVLAVCEARKEKCDDGTSREEGWCWTEGGDGDVPGDGDGDGDMPGDGDGDGDNGCGKVCEPTPGSCEQRRVCEAGTVCNPASDICVQCLNDANCFGTRCDTGSNTCVECLEDVDCNGDRCDLPANTCVQCLEDADCGDDRCDLDTNTCTECLSNDDCTSPGASQCIAGSCTGCGGSDAACSHLADTQVCAGDTCVQCTGQDYDACGEDPDSGRPLVCNSLQNTCSDRLERSTGLCRDCVSDAECKEGQLCVLQEFEESTVGYFCMWQQGGPGGAPGACLTEGRPFADTLNGATSIDGTAADVCTLAVSTCPALINYSSDEIECAPAGIADNLLCGGVAGDAYCLEADPVNAPGVHLCTVPCGSDRDCRVGFDCLIDEPQPYCEF